MQPPSPVGVFHDSPAVQTQITFLSWPGYAGEAYFCEQRVEAGPEFECVPQDDGPGTSNIEGNVDAIPSLSDKRSEIGTLDATVRYTPPENTWSVEAFVYNVTDERFQTYWVDSNQSDAPLFTWNAPRTWGVRFAYNVRPN